MKFKKGMKVTKYLHGAGVTSTEDDVVVKIQKEKVWVAGSGTPFINGKKDGVFGFWEEIKP